MTFRTVIVIISLLSFPALAVPSVLAFYDDQISTWQASHIVLIEDGKIKESWKGDLKVGQKLPEGAAIFGELVVPGSNPLELGAEKKPRPVTGRRLVVFLKHGIRPGGDDKKLVWMGAAWQSHPINEMDAAADVAWVEGDRIFTVVQPIRPGPYALAENGSLAGLKQRVDLGLAIRGQFEAARSESDRQRKADRVAAVLPIAAKYAPSVGKHDSMVEMSRCGKAAVPYLARWIADSSGEYADGALWAMSWLGDDGIDGMIKVLDSETAYWKAVANELKPGTTVRDVARKGAYLRVPIQLYHVLGAARRMKLSAANQLRLRNHAGLLELDRLLREKPGMKPDKSDMASAHEVLIDILAGKLGER